MFLQYLVSSLGKDYLLDLLSSIPLWVHIFAPLEHSGEKHSHSQCFALSAGRWVSRDRWNVWNVSETDFSLSQTWSQTPKLTGGNQCMFLECSLFFLVWHYSQEAVSFAQKLLLAMPVPVGSLVEDRVTVTLCQQTPFWSVFFSWAHVSPLVFALIFPDLLQVCFNFPTLLSPCGFSSFLVMLPAGLHRICPIHPHFRIFTSWQMGFWLFLSNRLPLETFLGYLIFRLCLRHMLVKVGSLQMVVLVTLHGSDPYRRTGFTLVVDILFFLWSDYALEFQMVPSMSGVVYPVFQGHRLIHHLRWLYFLDEMACLVDVFSCLLLNLVASVFFTLILKSVFTASSERHVSFDCTCCCLWKRRLSFDPMTSLVSPQSLL